MDVLKVLEDLRVYKTQLDDAIAVFDRLARARGKRGRPVRQESTRRPVNQEARKRMAAAQRKRSASARMKIAKS
jgi:hypothetical protein